MSKKFCKQKFTRNKEEEKGFTKTQKNQVKSVNCCSLRSSTNILRTLRTLLLGWVSPRPDVELLKGPNFLEMVLPQNIPWIPTYFVNITVCLKVEYICIPLCYPNLLLCTHLYPYWKQTANIWSFILPQEGETLNRLCPCVHDKFHICLRSAAFINSDSCKFCIKKNI